MTYGHADKIAKNAAKPPEKPVAADREQEKAATPGGTSALSLPPEWYAAPELHPLFTSHDVGGLFRALGKLGISQRELARLTGRTQSNISEIVHGRQVISYDVLVAITVGLGVPPERMGVSWWGPNGRWYGPPDAYPGRVTVANTLKEVSPEMLRRHLIAWGGVIMAGAPVQGIGELLTDLGGLPPISLPSQLSREHVVQVRDMTRRLGVGDTCCADAQMASATAAIATRLLSVPGSEQVTRALMVALAELRIEAGWAAFDAGLYHHALYHYSRALELARKAKDAYCQALALGYAGLASIEHGHPNDGLMMKQAAQVASWGIPSDDPRAVVVGEMGRDAVEACQLVSMGTALARLGQHTNAARAVAQGRDLWTPTPADPFGDPDRSAAWLELGRGRLDVAEALATASLRRWEGGRQLSRIQSGIVQATIYVQAGEPRGLQMAHRTITDVSKLSSVRIRRQLIPLAETLEARPQSDAKELARAARQVAV